MISCALCNTYPFALRRPALCVRPRLALRRPRLCARCVLHHTSLHPPPAASTPAQARTKIRVVCARPYHALFMHNMLIRPTPEELANFGEPDFVIYNSGGWRVAGGG